MSASPTPVDDTEGITHAIDQARAAFDRHEWGAAHDLFSSAAAEEPLDPDDLDRRATAAYLYGHDEEAFELWAEGHREREAAGDVVTAARFGSRIAQGLADRTGALPFGSDAAMLEAARSRIESQIGAAGFHREATYGSTLSGDDIVATALHAIASLRTSLTRATSN